MNTQIRKRTNWKRIDTARLLKQGAWLLIVVASIVYSLAAMTDDLKNMQSDVNKLVYVHLNFGSFVLGLAIAAVIFWRKPKDWMALITSLMLVTFTSLDDGFRFWYPMLSGYVFSGGGQFVPLAYAAALLASMLYMALLTTSLVYVLLTFPEGRLVSSRSRLFFIGVVIAEGVLIVLMGIVVMADFLMGMNGNLSYPIYVFLDGIKSLILIPLAMWQIYHLRKITDPIKRQQVKWIVTGLTGMTIFYAIGSLVTIIFGLPNVPMWSFVPLLIFTYGFLVTFFIALERYRLWDMDSVVNKAMVYTCLTGILTVLGLGGAALLEFYAKNFLEQKSSWVGAFVLLPLGALFYPIRNGLQDFVDRYFKPEEVDFSGTLVELAPDAQLGLSSQDILRILIQQTVEQLNVSSAAIYIREAGGQLMLCEPVTLEAEIPQLVLDAKIRSQLEKGVVTVPQAVSTFSLYIPLIVTRASRPDFLGVLALGPRNTGKGYSTAVLKSLKKFGADAGKAIYLAQLRERTGQNILDRLAAIERGLLNLHKRVNV